MSCNYAVTAYKPTAVTAVLTANFTAENELNLIVIKANNLVVNLVTPEGLKPVVDVNVNGRISLAKLIRPKDETRDNLVFMTARYHMAVVSYDPEVGELVTRAYGNIKDRVGRPTEGEMLGVIDPDSTMMVLHLYTGLLKVVPLKLDSESELKAFNCRLEDLFAIDVQFLHGCKHPSIAYLAQGPSGRMLKTTSISIKEKELMKGPWENISVESQASILYPLPLPLGGVVVIGAETLCYHNEKNKLSIDPPCLKQSIVSCVGKVDDTRCLIGDVGGKLYMLFVETEERMNESGAVPVDLKLEVLGETVSSSSLAYLDNGVVFVGSTYGDSQLVKLCTTADVTGSFIQVMESFTNLGPILDMSVVDLDKQGQDLVISCSGFGKDGSLRVVRSGIGINEHASIDLSGIKGVWSISCGSDMSGLDNTLVVSFVGHTTVLSLCGEEVEETEIEGIASDQQTFHCSNVTGGKIIQVTTQAVRLINRETMKLICKWEPPLGVNISNVSCNSLQVAVAVGKDLYYIEIQQDSLLLISHKTMPHEVACVDISPLGGQVDAKADFCAIGLWTEISVSILRLPNLEPADNQLLGGDIIPRSVLMVTFGENHYLLCALGDGCLLYYQMQLPAGQLSTSKRVVLGTKPIVLKQFRTSGSTNVFACSNHPTIIYHSNQKILFSNVNLKEVNYLCTLNSDAFKESLAMVDDSTLTIGSMDQIQMLHIQTIPLGETARRIAYQEATETFAIACSRIDVQEGGNGNKYIPSRQSASTSLTNVTPSPPSYEYTVPTSSLMSELDVSTILLIDQTSFEALHGFQLLQTEQTVSLTSCTFGSQDDSKSTYYVVGTAFVNPNEQEPSKGRILVFEVTGNKTLHLVHEKVRDGAVYQVAPFNGKLVATVNFEVQVLSWSEEKGTLEEECKYTNTILALFIKTKGDFILVGDLLRSFKLVLYKNEEEPTLEEIAIDINLNPVFLSAIEMIDDETYIGADGRHIFICQKNSVATVEEDLRYMLQPSRMYIGDNINVFGRGSLVMEHPGSSPLPIIGKPILYGGVHGTIGLIGQLKPEVFTLLMKLQNNMSTAIKSVGHIKHEVYRSFANEHKTMIPEGFIDGDLVEQFLDLPQPEMAEICKGLKMTDSQGSEVEIQVEDVLKVVEDLSRLH